MNYKLKIINFQTKPSKSSGIKDITPKFSAYCSARSRKVGDGSQKTRDDRQKTGGWKWEMGDERWGTRDGKWEMGYGRGERRYVQCTWEIAGYGVKGVGNFPT